MAQYKMNDNMSYYLRRKHWLDAVTPPLLQHIKTLCGQILPQLRR